MEQRPPLKENDKIHKASFASAFTSKTSTQESSDFWDQKENLSREDSRKQINWTCSSLWNLSACSHKCWGKLVILNDHSWLSLEGRWNSFWGLTDGTVSEDWQRKNVNPIFQKGENNESEKPWPLLLSPWKVMGTISRHMKDENAIRNSQHWLTK